MFLTFNAQTGAITGYAETQPQAGSWATIPASAMQDPPLTHWDEFDKAFVDGDNGMRWNAATSQFEPGLPQYQNALYQKIKNESAAALEALYPDYASTTFLQMMEVETRAYAATASPVEADFPLLAQYATQRSQTFADAASEVTGMALFSYAPRAAIFARRERAILEVVNASTLAEALAAASVDWEAVVANAPDSPLAWPEPQRPGGGGGGGAVTWSNVQNKPVSFPPDTHGHGMSDITGLVDALAGKQGAGNYETAGAAAGAMTAHMADADPHPQYTTAAELAAAIAAAVAGTAKGVHAKEIILSTGAYISQAVNGLALATAASAVNRFYAFPFIPAQNVTVNELAVEVTTLAAGSAHLGIYADAAGSPGTKMIGSTTAVATGTVGVKTVAISNTLLSAGTVYWLVVWTSAAATLRTVAQGALAVIGLTSTLNAQYTSRLATSTFGALPASAPATTLTAGAVPWFRMKIA